MQSIRTDEFDQLDSAEDCAEFFRVSKRHFRERIATQPDFPKPVRLPSEHGRGHPRWFRGEVREYAFRNQER
jgi:hypothetical protein